MSSDGRIIQMSQGWTTSDLILAVIAGAIAGLGIGMPLVMVLLRGG